MEQLDLASGLSSIFLGTSSFNESCQLSLTFLAIKLIPAYWYIHLSGKKYMECLPQNHKIHILSKCQLLYQVSSINHSLYGWVLLLSFLHFMFFLQNLLYVTYISWCGLSCNISFLMLLLLFNPIFSACPFSLTPIDQTTHTVWLYVMDNYPLVKASDVNNSLICLQPCFSNVNPALTSLKRNNYCIPSFPTETIFSIILLIYAQTQGQVGAPYAFSSDATINQNKWTN